MLAAHLAHRCHDANLEAVDRLGKRQRYHHRRMDSLGAADLKHAVVTYRDLLRTHQERINRLNVYPVPDGDTGTNMALTVESVVTELAGAADMPAVCKAMSHGSLMGARGNSGVILSQILRGMAKAFHDAGDCSADVMRTAL